MDSKHQGQTSSPNRVQSHEGVTGATATGGSTVGQGAGSESSSATSLSAKAAGQGVASSLASCQSLGPDVGRSMSIESQEDTHSVPSVGSGSLGSTSLTHQQPQQQPLQASGNAAPFVQNLSQNQQQSYQQQSQPQQFAQQRGPAHPVAPPDWTTPTQQNTQHSIQQRQNIQQQHPGIDPSSMTPVRAPDFNGSGSSSTSPVHSPRNATHPNMPGPQMPQLNATSSITGLQPLPSNGSQTGSHTSSASSAPMAARVPSNSTVSVGPPAPAPILTPVQSITSYESHSPPGSITLSNSASFNTQTQLPQQQLTQQLQQQPSQSQQSQASQQNQPPSQISHPPDSTPDTSLLCGLDFLERQQVESEKRREAQMRKEAEMKNELELQQQQQMQTQQNLQMPQNQQPNQQGMLGDSKISSGQVGASSAAPSSGPSGLPPLAPMSSEKGLSNPSQHKRRTTIGDTSNMNVPSQIHVLDEDENTALTSDLAGGEKDSLKRVTSIEKFGKYIRQGKQVSLRRFRSWSQDKAAVDNPASSVDSTQNASISRASYTGTDPATAGTGGGTSAGATGTGQVYSLQPKSGKDKVTGDIAEPFLDDDELKPLIYGYLHKLGRNGHWQKRFFETNGERLTYYKNVKRVKVLATLDLCKVGEIAIDKTDPEECTFTIQVSNRPYYLRAEDKARCKDWVITLNRAREARMNVGNIQLANPSKEDLHRSQAGSDDYAPQIVISPLRPRTQAVNFDNNSVLPPDLLTSGEEIEVLGHWDHPPPQPVTPPPITQVVAPPTPTDGQMAKWQKRHSTMHQLSLRFLNWARSITKQDACRREKDVVVVPAHVMRSMMAHENVPPPPPPPGGQDGPARARENSSELPELPEETPAKDGDSDAKSRARTDSSSSPAFGIGSSRYV